MKYIKCWLLQLRYTFLTLCGLCMCGKRKGIMIMEMRLSGGEIPDGKDMVFKGLACDSCATDALNAAMRNPEIIETLEFGYD